MLLSEGYLLGARSIRFMVAEGDLPTAPVNLLKEGGDRYAGLGDSSDALVVLVLKSAVVGVRLDSVYLLQAPSTPMAMSSTTPN